jgi:hypothetical protein
MVLEIYVPQERDNGPKNEKRESKWFKECGGLMTDNQDGESD